ncbi:MAG: hypothetical protein JXQ23_04985 [Clostridia bacterium]|nr:hypothetical protein [Clostridia bacterium]
MNTIPVIITDIDPTAQIAADILQIRLSEIEFNESTAPMLLSYQKKESSGFLLEINGNNIVISAEKKREFIAATGRLLDLIRRSQDTGENLHDCSLSVLPAYPIRIHYMPAHFGNSFEVAWPGEMRRYLEDLTLAGASGYGDWFDPNDMPDPYQPEVYCSTSMSLWKRKKEFLRIAKSLGLDTMLWVAHNVGFVNQLTNELKGIRSHKLRVQGQVLCTSVQHARNICLQNQRNLFLDLKASGIDIDKVCFGPYDDGGCACDKCQPYYPTFLRMVTEIFTIIKDIYPAVKMDICGWWASEEEQQQLKEYVNAIAKDRFVSFQYSATYDVFEIPGDIRGTVGDIPLSTFFHIGFSHVRSDVYLKTGIHSAPLRIKSVINSFSGVQCLGFHTYNESFGDHFNAYLCSRLGYDPDLDIYELSEDYCRMMFQLKGEQLKEMVDVLLAMEFLDGSKAGNWVTSLEKLANSVITPKGQKWAFMHVLLKAELMKLDFEIGNGADWKSKEDVIPLLPLILKRIELSEQLWRGVYGLGILRHAFIEDNMMPDWYKTYMCLFQENTGHIAAGSVMHKNA